MLNENKTIWHAVSAISKKEGQASWNLAKLIKNMTEKLELDPPDWVTGKDCGIFGETPLHIALLWNKPDTPGLTPFFNELWGMCPLLRTMQYSHPLYRGENVLHIAIVKKVDAAIIRRIVESDEWPQLREHRAVGLFFKHKDKSDGACNILGEHALSFAACTNQRLLFRYMVSKGASLRITTSEGNGLLHLMVLNAFGEDSAGRDSAAGNPAGGGCADGRPEVVDMYKGMYDEIERCMGEQGILEAMRRAENRDSHTPLKLAAAVGSLAMFNHLFDKEVEVAWVFGPVVCRKLYLKGIDVPLRRPGAARGTGTSPGGDGKPGGEGKLPRYRSLSDFRLFAPWPRPSTQGTGERSGGECQAECMVEDEGGGRSVLEILVDHERKDILAHSLVDKVIEAKWARYGRGIFHARLACAVVFTGLVYLAPMASPAHLSTGCRVAHAVVYVAACAWFAPDFFNEVDGLRRLLADALSHAALPPGGPAAAGAPAAGAPPPPQNEGTGAVETAAAAGATSPPLQNEGAGAVETAAAAEPRARRADLISQVWSKLEFEGVFSLLATPILVALTAMNLFRGGVPAAPGSCWCWCPPTTCNTTEGAPAEGAPGAVAEGSLLRDLEKAFYALLSVLSFLRLLYLGMGFENYGAFILMIVRITRKDLPVFMAVYTVFLFGVGHLHYFASNELHAGVLQGMDSVWRIFSAVTGDIHPEDQHVLTGPLAHPLTMAVCVANFFFVTIVLMNLLIAMLSQTYDEISRDARESWKLHRAAILVKIDRATDPARRASNVFWQTSPSEAGARRFITFNCFHGRADFLRQDSPGSDTLLLPTPPGSESEATAGAPGAADKEVKVLQNTIGSDDNSAGKSQAATQLTLEAVKARMDAVEGKLDRLLAHILKDTTTPTKAAAAAD